MISSCLESLPIALFHFTRRQQPKTAGGPLPRSSQPRVARTDNRLGAVCHLQFAKDI